MSRRQSTRVALRLTRAVPERGATVAVSTGPLAFCRATPHRECDRLARAIGWHDTGFRPFNRIAAAAAFCDETTRKTLTTRLEQNDA